CSPPPAALLLLLSSGSRLSGVTGLTGHDPAVSRLICTPIPPGQCNTGKFEQQADDPSLYAGEDWGYLRTTAEDLRQTVLQQKDQIQSDQRTIHELTGKLSECEKGLHGRTRRGGPAGLWGGAIAQLQDRIEKLEGDMSWTGEDLEGELQKKLDLLDKERKALRLETHKQRQAIDQSIAKLHHRVSGLEEGTEPNAFPEGFRLSFPTRTNYMYAAVNQHIPKLHAFTICMWLRPADKGIGTPLSYAVPDQPNEVVLLQGLRTPVELLVNDKVVQLPLNISRGSWQHICVSWSQRGGTWQAFQGGRLRGEGHSLAAGHHIRPGGLLVLGQEQDTVGGGFDSTQALVGEMSQVGVWDRVLSANQVASLSRCSKITQGGVAVWTESQIQVHGGATKDPGEPCSKHSMSSQ
uniref:Pentraxin (PTX) domain-containing protein n=1 Tax=Periophthalmus magnuspinnatus TaxID=409849 RepID=A0A3B4A811_9GOBI